MLLDFAISNYKSFVEETRFSMLAVPRQRELNYSVANVMTKPKPSRVLCSSVIYGPNASGKTNIISALDVLKSIVLRGHIRNVTEQKSPNAAAFHLELIPNSFLKKSRPVSFAIDFVEERYHFHYELSLDLGRFLDTAYERRVLEESLSIDGKEVFHRNDSLFFDHPEVLGIPKGELDWRLAIGRDSLSRDELFLSNGFKIILSKTFADLIIGWFDKKLNVVCRADCLKVELTPSDVEGQPKRGLMVDDKLSDAAGFFGVSANKLGFAWDKDRGMSQLCSVFGTGAEKRFLPAEVFESYGTLRFVNMLPALTNAIANGGTVVMDEFDASIHPKALMNLITIFHDDEINVNHAQLIFNTHNPIFLNGNLFRRDEIKFVERSDESHESSLYSMADFGTSGANGVRKGEDYISNYFVNKYGAISEIDFTPIFKAMAGKGEEKRV